ncbi:hypothetical protein E4U59_007358, partial [Claviceps monticola]
MATSFSRQSGQRACGHVLAADYPGQMGQWWLVDSDRQHVRLSSQDYSKACQVELRPAALVPMSIVGIAGSRMSAGGAP